MRKAKNYRKFIAIILGTGFGSTFMENGIPQITCFGVSDGAYGINLLRRY